MNHEVNMNHKDFNAGAVPEHPRGRSSRLSPLPPHTTTARSARARSLEPTCGRARLTSRHPLAWAGVLTLALAACGGEEDDGLIPNIDIEDGFEIQSLVTGLDFPTAVALSGDRMWVSESGIAPPPTIKEVDAQGNATVLLSAAELPEGTLVPPLTDVTYHDGWLWITHLQRGVNDWNVGAVSRFDPSDPVDTFETVITNLPNAGDHHVNAIVFDDSGRAYISIGTATNSGVVGLDNLEITGWLDKYPEFHDFPPVDIVLDGDDFTTDNPLSEEPDDTAVTAPFMAFGSGPVDSGTIVPAATPTSPQNGIIAGNGTVYSFDPSAADAASTMTLEAWGLRNPFGIGIDPLEPDVLFATNNGADIRGVEGENTNPDELMVLGSRPIASDFDDLFAFGIGDGEPEYFGWPDYFHDPLDGSVVPVTDASFCTSDAADIVCPDFLLDESFRQTLDPQAAYSQFTLHSSANKFGFSPGAFGFTGDLFVAETGSFIPITGAETFTGYKVVRVDRLTGEVEDFAVNTGATADEVFDPAGFNKPIDVKFRDDGAMLIVDFGVFEPGLMINQPGTGKIWIVRATD